MSLTAPCLLAVVTAVSRTRFRMNRNNARGCIMSGSNVWRTQWRGRNIANYTRMKHTRMDHTVANLRPQHIHQTCSETYVSGTFGRYRSLRFRVDLLSRQCIVLGTDAQPTSTVRVIKMLTESEKREPLSMNEIQSHRAELAERPTSDLEKSGPGRSFSLIRMAMSSV